MYFDEDGDLAHEFYEETIVTKNGRKKAKLKKIQKNLTPQVGNANCTFTLKRSVFIACCPINFNVFYVFSGNYKAGLPVHPCRFPSCYL